MPSTDLLAPQPATPAVRSRGVAASFWRRLAGALRRCLPSLGLDDDQRYLAEARSLEELEQRQRRLERHGSPLPPAWLP
jgi:hypothetical protein